MQGDTSHARSNARLLPDHPVRRTVECSLCGTRLRRDDDTEITGIDGDLLTTVARHRCVPRVGTGSAPPRTDD